MQIFGRSRKGIKDGEDYLRLIVVETKKDFNHSLLCYGYVCEFMNACNFIERINILRNIKQLRKIVIIDYKDALKNGFIKINKYLLELLDER